MSESDGLNERVTRLEREMVDVRADTAVARTLSMAADRDVSEVRDELHAHNRVLNALRTTQLEQGQELRVHSGMLNALRTTQLEQGQELQVLRQEMQEGFTKVGLGMAQIGVLLQQAIDDPGKN